MHGKRQSIQMIAPPKKKRKSASTIEEIAFDFGAREDYLTGFHKRKLQRIKHAKEEAAKKEREEKLAARKILRDGRKADLEKHVDAVNSMLRDRDDVASDSSMQDSGGEEDHWNGIQDEPVVDHEDEYTDEGRFTTVTVEAVDVSRDGLRKAIQDGIEEKEDSGPDLPNTSPGRASQQGSVGQEKAKRIWTKEPPSGLKKKKKKFRYESKAERKITRHKERSGNKSKAKARRE